MRRVALLTWLAALAVTLAFEALHSPGGPQKLQRMTADTYKVFASFPYAVGISFAPNTTKFSCLSAKQLEIDSKEKTTTYLWNFPSLGLEIPFKVKTAEKPGTMRFTVGEDLTQREGILYYTDYKDCAIADLEYDGHVCLLWARREVKDSVPQRCIDYYEDTCGVTAQQHSRDLCWDGEGDY
uniref:Putative lipocalin-5 1 n=1 Tax=Rhipicephalus microplus TaxID=6941 RepID=A0A6M2CIK6_RHIMP